MNTLCVVSDGQFSDMANKTLKDIKPSFDTFHVVFFRTWCKCPNNADISHSAAGAM